MPRKVRTILYVENTPDDTIRSSHYSLLDLVCALDRVRFKPVVVFHRRNPLIPVFEKYCEVFLLERGPRGLGTIAKIKTATWNFFQVARFLVAHRVDVVHLNYAPVLTDWLFAAKLLGRSCISHLRENWSPTKFQRRILPDYDLVISVSNAVTEHVKQWGADVQHIVTIYDGIYFDGFVAQRTKERATVRAEFGIPDDAPTIVVPGNIGESKGQHIAIEAVAILRERNPSRYENLHCLIVGECSSHEEDQAYFARLRELTSARELNRLVHFAGFRADRADVLGAVDILVLPSVQPEPFGRVLLEGMALSLPMIATNHGGAVEIIQDGVSGYLIPSGDSQALADKIDDLVSDPECAKRVGDAGLHRVRQQFALETTVKRIEKIYARLLREKM